MESPLICCHGNKKLDDVKGAVSPIFEVTLNVKNICIDGIVKNTNTTTPKLVKIEMDCNLKIFANFFKFFQ